MKNLNSLQETFKKQLQKQIVINFICITGGILFFLFFSNKTIFRIESLLQLLNDIVLLNWKTILPISVDISLIIYSGFIIKNLIRDLKNLFQTISIDESMNEEEKIEIIKKYKGNNVRESNLPIESMIFLCLYMLFNCVWYSYTETMSFINEMTIKSGFIGVPAFIPVFILIVFYLPLVKTAIEYKYQLFSLYKIEKAEENYNENKEEIKSTNIVVIFSLFLLLSILSIMKYKNVLMFNQYKPFQNIQEVIAETKFIIDRDYNDEKYTYMFGTHETKIQNSQSDFYNKKVFMGSINEIKNICKNLNIKDSSLNNYIKVYKYRDNFKIKVNYLKKVDTWDGSIWVEKADSYFITPELSYDIQDRINKYNEGCK